MAVLGGQDLLGGSGGGGLHGSQPLLPVLDAEPGDLQLGTTAGGVGGAQDAASAVPGLQGCDLALEGKGVREGNSLRCASVSGSVIEGIDDPVYVGDFRMELAMPAADASEEKALRKSHKAKVDARPAPPPKYAVSAFFGSWRLLVALETTRASPTVDLHSIEFTADYPYKAPVIKFTTPIFHPNVDVHGNICLDILKEKWSATYSVKTVLISLQVPRARSLAHAPCPK